MQMTEAGFKGEYPSYKKKGSEVFVFEEHPFTVGEMDNMEFSLHLLEHVQGDLKHSYQLIKIENIKKN